MTVQIPERNKGLTGLTQSAPLTLLFVSNDYRYRYVEKIYKISEIKFQETFINCSDSKKMLVRGVDRTYNMIANIGRGLSITI